MDVATMHLAGRPKSQAVLLLVTILLVLLVSYSILCIWHSSRDGLLAYLSTWRGLSDLLLISVGLLTVSSQYNRALHFALITDYLDKEPRDKYTSLFSPLKTKGQASDIFCSFCGFLMFNMSCTLFKFKMFEGLHRVFARVYKVGIAAFFILNTYAILIGIHSIMHNTELGNLFVLQFTFKEEIFHTFNQESKVLYILFTPIIYALFKFHIGYLVSSHGDFYQEWELPTFFTSGRFRPKKPKPLSRRRKIRSKRNRTRRPPGSKQIQKLDDSFQLIK